MPQVTLLGYQCGRCGHEWVPRDKTQKPRVCPKCKNPYWDRPRKGDENGGRETPPQSSGESEE